MSGVSMCGRKQQPVRLPSGGLMGQLLILGFAKTLDLSNIGLCHNASDIVCPGATRPKYGRATVHGEERGSFRKLGVAVIWGDDSRKTRSLVNACPDPIVIVCTPAPSFADPSEPFDLTEDGPVLESFLLEAITAVVKSGRQCHVVMPGADEPLTVVYAGLGSFKVLHGDAPPFVPLAPAPDPAEPAPDSPVVASAEVEAPVGAPE